MLEEITCTFFHHGAWLHAVTTLKEMDDPAQPEGLCQRGPLAEADDDHGHPPQDQAEDYCGPDLRVCVAGT